MAAGSQHGGSIHGRRTLVVIAFLFAAFSLFCVADCMRETDQASVLIGAWKLFRGSHVIGQPYYNYDKLYVTYWITALGFWLCSLFGSHFGSHWSPVLVGNITSTLVFWATTVAAVVLFARRRRKPAVLALICYLSTSAILINSVYTNAAILSAGFLLLAGAILSTSRTLGGRALGALVFFVAVGARGDAVLLAPLLVWLQLPTRHSIRRAFTGSTTWLLAAAIGASTLLGRMIYTGKPLYFDPVFLGSKVVLGYLVFGLGASLPLLCLLWALLFYRAVRAPSVERVVFYLAGAVALAFPLCYYLLQLWSPRYLVTTALGVFLFSASRRGQALLKLPSRRRTIDWLRFSFAALAAVMLVAGVRLQSPTRPHLTIGQPTLFPTADGLHPMGDYAGFLLRIRHVTEREIDHNQIAWKAAQQARYVPDADGFVHVLDTPMQAYLRLGATLKGLPSKVEFVRSDYDLRGQLYAESRTFMRLGSDQADTSLSRLLTRPAKIVSPVYEGVAILRFTPDGDPAWGLRTSALDNLFMGNEYRLYDPDLVHQYAGTDARPFALVAGRPFEVAINGREAKAGLDRSSGLYCVRGNSQQLSQYQFFSYRPVDLTLAIQTLPDWMSVGTRK